jgi:hypothetical protein
MDKFNFNRFFREIKPHNPSKGMNYAQQALSKKSIGFSEFWNVANKEISSHKFLSLYFKSKTVSPEILSFFFQNELDVLKAVIKETKAFRKNVHFDSIKNIFLNDTSFILEMEYWKKVFHEIELELEKHNSFLSGFNLEELLAICSFYYEKERITKQIERNTDYHLIEIINEILNYRFSRIKALNKPIVNTHSDESLYKFGIKLLGQLLYKGDQSIAGVFNSFGKLADLNNIYDKYCVQEFTLSFFDSNTANVKPINEENYLKYKHDGNKYQYWANYYTNSLAFQYPDVINEIEESEISWYNKIGAKTVWANFYQYVDAGFPEKIRISENDFIEPMAFFRIINSLGGWSNIRWNNFIEQQVLDNNLENPYKIILDIMLFNEREYKNSALPLLFREFDMLVKQAEEINRTEKDTGRFSISLFTNNLSDSKTSRINISDKPFVKIGKNIYWIAGILSNKNYSVMLQNIMLQNDRKKDEGSPTKLFSQNTENNLAYWFEQNKFKTIKNHVHVEGRGEIDLLALKDKTLFIGEIKSTFYRSSVREIHMHFSNEDTGIKKAIFQLEKDINYLNKNWKTIKRLLETDLEIKDLKIIPLAISSTLEEGNGTITVIGYKGFIVSSFDLTLILTNRKFHLLNLFEVAMSMKFKGSIPLN